MVLQLIFSLIYGLIFGSFVSALTWRYPRGISINKGRSICPNCKHQINWFDNIPLLSFLILGGKCRNCKLKISWRYPAIEFTSGVGFLLISYFIGNNIFTLFYCMLLFLILLSILVIDLENKIIPDSFTFTGIGISVIYFLLTDNTMFIPGLLVGLIAAFLLLAIHLFTKGRGMGLGDVKFAVLGGLIVGPRLFLIWLFLAFLTGAVIGIILILVRKAGLKSQIAFGPFLVISIPLALLYGEKILWWIHIS